VEQVAKLARPVWGNLVSIYFEGGTGTPHWSLRGSQFLRHSGANKRPAYPFLYGITRAAG